MKVSDMVEMFNKGKYPTDLFIHLDEIKEINDKYYGRMQNAKKMDSIFHVSYATLYNTEQKLVRLQGTDKNFAIINAYVYLDDSFPKYRKNSKVLAAWITSRFQKDPAMLKYQGSVGSDPEIFAIDKEGGIVPAFNFLPGKDKPVKGPDGNQSYWDGFQAEFNTVPYGCLAYHSDSVHRGLRDVYREMKKAFPDAELSIRNTVNVTQEQLDKASPEQVAFGCMPSLNAYGMEGLKADGKDTPTRSAGGHIHFGVNKDIQAKHVQIVQALDAIIGVACVSLFASVDDPSRRVMYGLAGEYRLPVHGIEYRTLSNGWLSHPLIMNLVFDIARKAFMVGVHNKLNEVWQHEQERTIQIINNCDVAGARQVLKANETFFKLLIERAYGPDKSEHNAIFNIFMNGMESVVKDPTDIVTNWGLKNSWISHGNGKNFAGLRALVVGGKKVA